MRRSLDGGQSWEPQRVIVRTGPDTYNDDHGASWRIGGVAHTGTDESSVVETAAGALYLNCRNYVGARRRASNGTYSETVCQNELLSRCLASWSPRREVPRTCSPL